MDVCCDLASELSRIRLNSDRGTQYTSSLFQKWCAANQVTQSMGAVGLFWDHTVAESFFPQMKTEMYYQHEFENHLTARTAVMEYIESWYNRRRPHSRNGGLQPAVALAAHRDARQTAAAQKKNQSDCLNNLTGASPYGRLVLGESRGRRLGRRSRLWNVQ
ncbi:integrase core domain-containing protein [Cryobacterium sp. Hh7]|uniref:integrase core domain-containing protein n=1 Tax=Cryobacterium sp. Hh7 TaxID=1259159 RepID=UPI00351A356D